MVFYCHIGEIYQLKMQITISIVTVNTVIENVISDISIICSNVNAWNIVSLSLKCRILF